ncbi:MAG TPA: hypothetical protein VFT46_05215 [Holophagaceae bacterium]|nr:hypothetical protein [Holophagaceae bacterium]
MNLALFAGLHLLRDAPAVLDGPLAARLGLAPEALRAEVAKDPGCFPEELVFRLTAEERAHLSGAELAFTEGGTALLAAKLPQAPVLEALTELAEARGAWLDQARLAQRVEALERELKAVEDLLRAAREAVDKTSGKDEERPIGFAPEDLPQGLKAKARAERDGR